MCKPEMTYKGCVLSQIYWNETFISVKYIKYKTSIKKTVQVDPD